MSLVRFLIRRRSSLHPSAWVSSLHTNRLTYTSTCVTHAHAKSLIPPGRSPHSRQAIGDQCQGLLTGFYPLHYTLPPWSAPTDTHTDTTSAAFSRAQYIAPDMMCCRDNVVCVCVYCCGHGPDVRAKKKQPHWAYWYNTERFQNTQTVKCACGD